MNLKSYLKLVEIQTKVASVIPFLVGVAYTYYRYQTLNLLNLLIFFVSLICMDMATTAINNFMDYKKAVKREGFNYEQHNAVVRYNLSENQVKSTIAVLLTVAAVAGIVLVFRTDLVILIIGMLAFVVGVTYSYGPIPISRTPLGEVVSGVMMGGFIFFVTVYSQVFHLGFIRYDLNKWIFDVQMDLQELLILALVSVPLILMIAGIMLANNICDMKDDLENLRYTLPIFIGKKISLILFTLIYVGSYIAIVAAVILGVLPLTSLLVLLTSLPVFKHVKLFHGEQKKATTFVVAVKNFVLMGGAMLMALLIHIIFNLIVGI